MNQDEPQVEIACTILTLSALGSIVLLHQHVVVVQNGVGRMVPPLWWVLLMFVCVREGAFVSAVCDVIIIKYFVLHFFFFFACGCKCVRLEMKTHHA